MSGRSAGGDLDRDAVEDGVAGDRLEERLVGDHRTGEPHRPERAALRAEGVPAHLVYGGKPVYAEPQILHRRTHPGTPVDPQSPAYTMGMCPRTEALLKHTSTLPIHPHLTAPHLDNTIQAFEKVTTSLA